MRYTGLTASVVTALVQKGWSAPCLPGVRTISNLLNRQNYGVRTIAKTRFQKNNQDRRHL